MKLVGAFITLRELFNSTIFFAASCLECLLCLQEPKNKAEMQKRELLTEGIRENNKPSSSLEILPAYLASAEAKYAGFELRLPISADVPCEIKSPHVGAQEKVSVVTLVKKVKLKSIEKYQEENVYSV